MNSLDDTFIGKLKTTLSMNSVPKGVNISTMTMLCEFKTVFKISNIGLYAPLDINKINSVRYVADGEIKERSVVGLIKKKQRRKTKKTKSNFYNQTSIAIRCFHDEKIVNKRLKEKAKKDGNTFKAKIKTINIKIFKNGSVQLTGCKSIEGFYEVLKTMCQELSKVRGKPDKNFTKIEKISFIEKPQNFSIKKLIRPRIAMINSDFNLGFSIDRNKLYSILKDISNFEPDKHAPVNIKYGYKNRKKLSIFVFESGAVVITGVNNSNQIKRAYNYVNNIINENFKNVVLIDKSYFKDNEIENLIDDNDLEKGKEFDNDFEETLKALLEDNT